MITIDVSDFAKAIKNIEEREQWLRERTEELVQRLTDYGVLLASVAFEGAAYDGVNDVKVTFEEQGELTRAIVATGEAVLFIEFGAGVTYGFGHPEPLGYGPGTYPGKGHWNDPNGWYYDHGKKSYGNPPAEAMYNARKQIEEDIETIAQEVFSH